jgi:hypothetical protein
MAGDPGSRQGAVVLVGPAAVDGARLIQAIAPDATGQEQTTDFDPLSLGIPV